MSFAIPDPFVWDESFRVDYEYLDAEHKSLFQALFDLGNKPGDHATLLNLVIVTAHHFGDEEGALRAKNYSDFTSHKSAHDEFLGKLKGLNTPVDGATVSWAKNWLVNHIKSTDFKYKGKL